MPANSENSKISTSPKPALTLLLEVNEDKGAKIVYSEGKVSQRAEEIINSQAASVKDFKTFSSLIQKLEKELKFASSRINSVDDLKTPGAAFYEVEFSAVTGQYSGSQSGTKTAGPGDEKLQNVAPRLTGFSRTLSFHVDTPNSRITELIGDIDWFFSPGFNPENITITALMRKVHPADFRQFKLKLRGALQGDTSAINYRIYSDDQQLKYVRHFVHTVSSGGRIAGISNLIVDVTDDKELIGKLRSSEEKLRILFETADDLIFVLDQTGGFSSVNALGALSLEFLPEEMIGKHFISFIDEPERKVIAISFKELLKASKLVTFEAAFITKFGKRLTFEINARPVYSQKNRFDGIVGIGRNVTSRIHDHEMMNDLNNKLIEANRIISIERDRVKQRISVLEELNHLKSEFVANISHELRTPLASIIGFSETIDSDTDMPESVRIDFNKIILTESKRLADLINDVLDISKLEGGKVVLDKSDFDPIDLITEAVSEFRKNADEKSITILEEYPDVPVIINADKERLTQVFENIISNAVKFTNPGGRITIFVRLRKNELEAIISDTGVGIPKKDLPYIFQKFYKVSRTDNSLPGSGLGLALVKQIIDLHKGYINLKSEENNGTTVIIKLQLNPKRYSNNG